MAGQRSSTPEADVSVEAIDAEVEGSLESSAHTQGTADEDLQSRISDSAYRRSEARGFAPGRELDDWLEAEREIQGR